MTLAQALRLRAWVGSSDQDWISVATEPRGNDGCALSGQDVQYSFTLAHVPEQVSGMGSSLVKYCTRPCCCEFLNDGLVYMYVAG